MSGINLSGETSVGQLFVRKSMCQEIICKREQLSGNYLSGRTSFKENFVRKSMCPEIIYHEEQELGNYLSGRISVTEQAGVELCQAQSSFTSCEYDMDMS